MKHIILLHGALGNRHQFVKIEKLLEPIFHLHKFDFSGHDGKVANHTFTIERFASELDDYLDHNLGSVPAIEISIFGYSMGGYIALTHEKINPGRIGKIITLATKFDWNPESSAREASMLNPAKMREKIPAYVKTLEEKYGGNWEQVVNATAEMMRALGENPPLRHQDYEGIQCPVQIMIGDKDTMVSLEESIAVYRSLPDSRLAVLPGVVHPIERINTGLLCNLMTDYLGE